MSVALAASAAAAPGELDPTFGGDGRVTTNFTPVTDDANDVAIQTDGKIVAVGGSGRLFALARYETDGSLDATFGGDGKVRTDFSDGVDRAHGVALQPDGRIVVAGIANVGRNARFALARYLPDGTLDPSFSTNGKVLTNLTRVIDGAQDIAIQDDGRIVAAGIAGVAAFAHSGTFALTRYLPDGTLDESFGGDGRVRTNFTEDFDGALGMAIQANGKVVAAGVAEGVEPTFALARYRRDGSLDDAFGGDGKVTTNFSFGLDHASDVAIQEDGRIVAAGFSGEPRWTFALARYLRDGTLDDSFGGDGKVKTRFSPGLDQANDVAIQDDGRIVAVGFADAPEGFDPTFALARYRRGGALDTSFGGDGRVRTNFTAGHDGAEAVAIQDDGRIVVAGVAGDSDDLDPTFALARYLAGGAVAG